MPTDPLRPPVVAPQQVILGRILSKAATHAAESTDTSRILMCEEKYEQTLVRARTSGGSDYGLVRERNATGGRTWLADLALMATPERDRSGLPWLEFRDITSIDGKMIRKGPSRLDALAADASAIAGLEALQVTRDTSLYLSTT